MRKLITGALGILCGIAIIVMAFLIQTPTANFEEHTFKVLDTIATIPSQIPDNFTGQKEGNKYYGGDAYTGIQQAAAQAANNILAMEETLLQTNENILAVNWNLRTLNDNLVDANANITEAAVVQQTNMAIATQSVCASITQVSFYLLLAVGMIMVVTHLNPFLDALEIVLAEKKSRAVPENSDAPEAPEAPEVPAAPAE